MKSPNLKYLPHFISFFLSFFFTLKVKIAHHPSDREEITQVVQLYFDGMMERNREKLDPGIISEARLNRL